jgi:hypothetical protein
MGNAVSYLPGRTWLSGQDEFDYERQALYEVEALFPNPHRATRCGMTGPYWMTLIQARIRLEGGPSEMRSSGRSTPLRKDPRFDKLLAELAPRD